MSDECETCGDVPCAHFMTALDGMATSEERIAEVTAWAESRIRHCREQETKFGNAWQQREKHQHGPPQALVEAWTERRALQAVVEMLRSTSALRTGDSNG